MDFWRVDLSYCCNFSEEGSNDALPASIQPSNSALAPANLHSSAAPIQPLWPAGDERGMMEMPSRKERRRKRLGEKRSSNLSHWSDLQKTKKGKCKGHKPSSSFFTSVSLYPLSCEEEPSYDSHHRRQSSLKSLSSPAASSLSGLSRSPLQRP